jgi:hypothetical protein
MLISLWGQVSKVSRLLSSPSDRPHEDGAGLDVCEDVAGAQVDGKCDGRIAPGCGRRPVASHLNTRERITFRPLGRSCDIGEGRTEESKIDQTVHLPDVG